MIILIKKFLIILIIFGFFGKTYSINNYNDFDENRLNNILKELTELIKNEPKKQYIETYKDKIYNYKAKIENILIKFVGKLNKINKIILVLDKIKKLDKKYNLCIEYNSNNCRKINFDNFNKKEKKRLFLMFLYEELFNKLHNDIYDEINFTNKITKFKRISEKFNKNLKNNKNRKKEILIKIKEIQKNIYKRKFKTSEKRKDFRLFLYILYTILNK